MKILFITDNFPPEVNAPATRTQEHCAEWLKRGASITVLTCFPNFPKGVVFGGYKNKLYQVEMIDGVRVIRLWSYMARNEGFAKRVIDYCSFAFMAFWAGLFQKADVIVATSPQFFTTWAGAGIAFVRRKPWVFELRDLWPETITAVGAIKNMAVIRLLERIELWLYRNCTMVVAVTDAFKANLIRRGIDANKIEVVTNGSNMELFSARPKCPKLTQQLKLEGKFVVGYIGTHGLTHRLDFIVRSIAKCKNPNVHFLFIGDGSEKKNVQSLAQSLQLSSVTFLDAVAKDQVPDYLSILDICLVPLAKSDTFKTVIPSKIFESASMLKPILLGVEGQAKQIVDEHNAGICFEPENETEFLAQIDRLMSDQSLYEKLQDGCKRLAAHYDRKILAGRMLDALATLTTRASSAA